MSLDLTETTAAVERYDAIDGRILEAASNRIQDLGVIVKLTEDQDEAGRAIVAAFARETADRNDEGDVLRFLNWDTPADRAFIRGLVDSWKRGAA